jgi:hypothetical protein
VHPSGQHTLSTLTSSVKAARVKTATSRSTWVSIARSQTAHATGNPVDARPANRSSPPALPELRRNDEYHQKRRPQVTCGYMLAFEIKRAGESAVDTKTHWERVYSTKRSDEVSWFQARPDPSLRLLDRAGIGPNT